MLGLGGKMGLGMKTLGLGMKMSGFGVKTSGFGNRNAGIRVKTGMRRAPGWSGISPGGADFPAFQPLLPEFPALPAGAAALAEGLDVGKGFFWGIFPGEIPDFPRSSLTEYMAFSSSKALAFLMASASSLSFLSILFQGKTTKKPGISGSSGIPREKGGALSQNFRGKWDFRGRIPRKNGICKAEFQRKMGFSSQNFREKGRA